MRRFIKLMVGLVLLTHTASSQSPDTVNNLIQWPATSGGNDHWYAVIPLTMQWVDHAALAPTLVHDGMNGYLATITSREENNFIYTEVVSGLEPDAVLDLFYLSGQKTDESWNWLTGEPFVYSNWAVGEPSSHSAETALGIYGDSNSVEKIGKWNNVPPDTSTGEHHRLWSVVEWGPLDTSTAIFINLTQWPAAEGGNDHWYAVVPQTKPWIAHKALASTLQYDGLRGYLATITSQEENDFIFEMVISGLNPDAVSDQFYLSGEIVGGIWLWLTGEPMPYENWAPGEPNNTDVETVVTVLGDSNDQTRIGKWNNVPSDTTLGPRHQLWALIEFRCCDLRGNVDGISGVTGIDIADLLYFVDYQYGNPSGPSPPCFEEGDLDDSDTINVADLLYMVDYMFASPPGPAPVACP